jgi:pimeloyl-ACP methyl ester carboxylesterase
MTGAAANSVAVKEPLQYRLADGHGLSYRLLGEPSGYPVCYCHGFPGSRLEADITHKAASALGICVVAADRPGFGRSDFQPRRQMQDWVSTARELMYALGHRRFSVLGISGGGPYALLMAEHLDHCVDGVGIVGGLGSLADPGSEAAMGRAQQSLIRFARAYPQQALFIYRYALGAFMGTFPASAVKILLSRAPKVDRAALAEPEIRSIYLNSIVEAFAQGGLGPAWELHLFTRQWQVNPAAVKMKVFLWHGELDATVPASMGRCHAEQLPDCMSEFLPHEGHFSLPLHHMERILSRLIP